jgi:tripartite-type tricarboxylate transporter receptor subunit TctC
MVPTGVGGPNDVVLQVLSQKFSQITGQNFVIENRAGASGTIAAEAVVRAAPDGYTLLAAIPTILSINPHVFKNPRYDAEKGFVPITQLLTTNYFLLGSANLAANNISELITLAKSNPSKISFGSAGVGSTSHLLVAMLGNSVSAEFLHVPYKGASLAIADLATGYIDTSVSAIETVREYVRTGKVKVLAVASPKRARTMPDVPTFVELGFPNVVATLWMGLVAPANTPPQIVNRLHSAISQALQAPDLREKLEAADQELVGSSPAEFTAFLKADRERWGIAVRASGFVINE